MRPKILINLLFACCVVMLLGRFPLPLLAVDRTHSPPFTAVVDTLDIYGGPETWLGKFQTADGTPDTQDWTTSDGTETYPDKWNISTYNAANLDTTVEDNHAWWCGEQFAACENDTVGGYGNSWETSLAWQGLVVDPSLPAVVTVTGIMNNDSEPGYDYTSLNFIIYGNQFFQPLVLNGPVIGLEFSESFTYSPEDYLGDEGQIMVTVLFDSDGAWSDEDCLYPSVGGAQVDNLQVTISQEGYPDYVSPVETCEPGDPVQWENIPTKGYGNFAQLWTDLQDEDPTIDNHSSQWAFLDDGLIEPGTGGTTCSGNFGCYGPNNWVVNIWGGLSEDPAALMINHVTSPDLEYPLLTSLPGEPLLAVGELVLAADVYLHSDEDCGIPIGLKLEVLSSADPSGLEGWESSTQDFFFAAAGPEYQRFECVFPVESLTPGVLWVKIQISALGLGVGCYEVESTPAPYFDNVRLQARLVEYSSSIPQLSDQNQISIFPNPFNPQTSVSFNLIHRQHVALAVYDVRGRLVAQLTDHVLDSGEHSVEWHGRDDAGRSVPSGEYFFKAEMGGRTVIKKAMLVR